MCPDTQGVHIAGKRQMPREHLETFPRLRLTLCGATPQIEARSIRPQILYFDHLPQIIHSQFVTMLFLDLAVCIAGRL